MNTKIYKTLIDWGAVIAVVNLIYATYIRLAWPKNIYRDTILDGFLQVNIAIVVIQVIISAQYIYKIYKNK